MCKDSQYLRAENGSVLLEVTIIIIKQWPKTKMQESYNFGINIYFSFGETGCLNWGLCVYKAGGLLLEPYLQSTLLWLFWR
jgi:hypothetical protein